MKTYRTLILSAIIILMVPYSGCEKVEVEDLPGDPVPIVLSDSELALAQSSNQFSFDIFKLIIEGEDDFRGCDPGRWFF